MLLYLTGSSCSGKTTLATLLAQRVPDLAVHDVDEPGVPRDASTEHWVRRALKYQSHGRDTLVVGQAPLGEVLATPSAPLIDGIAVCLLDVDDNVRRTRLAQRDPGKWDAAATDAFINWARWHRGHARDPRHRPEVLVTRDEPGMSWNRWKPWPTGDPRWAVHVVDTTDQPLERSLDQLEAWVTEQRHAQRSGTLPLGRGWDDAASQIPDLPWPTLSYREALAALVTEGWTPSGAGDWAVGLRSPDGTLVARVCPFDPAYSAFVALCRACDGNPWLPRMELAADLEGGGSVTFLEYVAPVDGGVAEQVAEQWRDGTGDEEFERVRRAAQAIDAEHRQSTPWRDGFDLNEAHVRRAADGRFVLIDMFCMDGMSLYGSILDDVGAVHRQIPRERMRYALEIPYIAGRAARRKSGL